MAESCTIILLNLIIVGVDCRTSIAEQQTVHFVQDCRSRS